MPRRVTAAGSLAAKRPDLVGELDPVREAGVDPWRLAAGSHRRLWWRCAQGHSWQASVANRARLGSGCPVCARARRRQVGPERSLAGRFPELAGELDLIRNQGLDPWALAPSSGRRVWWQGCAQGHPGWLASPRGRVRGAGCPYCAGVLPLPERSLQAHPELVARLDPERNGALNPLRIAARGPRRLWWRCEHGHSWQAPVARVLNGAGCPYCRGPRVTVERSLAAHPALLAELDPERNGELDPTQVAARGDRRLWWRCPEGHVWQAMVKSRVRSGTGCPVCAPRGRTGVLLAERSPDLVREWVDALNGGPPDAVTAGSDRKAWWRCRSNPAHLWRASVRNRVRQGSGCPFCAHQRVAPETSLAAVRPDLVAEWHPERNLELSPTDVLPHAHREVWWRCGAGHSWRARLTARARGDGCPECAAERRSTGYAQDRSRLEPLRRWAAEHGAPPSEPAWTAAGRRPTVRTLARHYGSWNAALAAAGLPTRPPRKTARWTRELAIAAIGDWTAAHGRPPTAAAWTGTDPRRPSASTAIRLFGSWTAALRAASEASGAASVSRRHDD